jgi:hypothetical protein
MDVQRDLRVAAARAGVVAVAGLLAVAVVGCGPTAGTEGDEGPSVTAELAVAVVDPQDPAFQDAVDRASDIMSDDDSSPVVLRGGEGNELLVVTRGSSSCPVTPRAGRWAGETYVLEVASYTAEDAEQEGTDRVCTDDLAPAVFAISVPDLPDDPLDVVVERVELVASSELPGRATARPEG